ncbi:MAG: alpha/beta hydrolase [Acidimicrobiales bacterium]
MTDFDEFSLLGENASEAGLADVRPPVARTTVALDDGRELSAVVWGEGPPQLVLLHGGAQNAHTWDTFVLALGRPVVALDLPGHGRSSWRDDGRYTPPSMAEDVATAIRAVAPSAAAVVGMSLGGLTAIALSATAPELVRRLVLVDITPGVDATKSAAIVNFVAGPPTFASFDELLARTVAFNPTRSERSLRRGLLHNAVELDDGSWAWRHHMGRGGASSEATDFGALWDDVGRVRVPVLLVRGATSPVVDDADVAELVRRCPHARVEVVAGAGHSVQGDQPLVLASLVDAFVGA